MIERAQILKGLLEGCILKIISRGETYGYQITKDLNDAGFSDLNEGSVYPVLIRIEKKGYVDTMSKKSSLGPKRKYFSLNTRGEKFLDEFEISWTEISETVNRLMEDKNE